MPMASQRLMAHMMCLRHRQNNRIPWCRANGWILFSLSELLMKLAQDHPRRGTREEAQVFLQQSLREN